MRYGAVGQSNEGNMKIEDVVGHRISKADAIVANEELRKIRQHFGKITKELIVEWARPKKSPLHKHFVWNNSEAAHQHRLAQAGALIRSIKIKIRFDGNREPETFRAHVSVIDANGPDYRPLIEVMSQKETRAQLLREALAELDTWRRKYRLLSELSVVIDEEAIAQLTKRAKRKAA